MADMALNEPAWLEIVLNELGVNRPGRKDRGATLRWGGGG